MGMLGVDIRRLGTAMLAFGLIGVLIAGVVAAGMFAVAVSARNLDERIATEQAYIVDALGRVDASVAKLVATTENGSATLATTADTLGTADGVLGQVADTATELSRSIDISILGSRPLAGAASRLGQLATSVTGFQAKTAALVENLGTNATDMQELSGQIETLRGDLVVVSERIEGFQATGSIVSLLTAAFTILGLLVAWLAVGAAFLGWAGLRLRRIAAEVAATPAPVMPDPNTSL